MRARGSRPPPYDGVAELWRDNLEELLPSRNYAAVATGFAGTLFVPIVSGSLKSLDYPLLFSRRLVNLEKTVVGGSASVGIQDERSLGEITP